MILTIIILCLLVWGFFHGKRQGLLRMLLNIVSYVIAIVVAKAVATTIGNWLAGFFPILTSQTANSSQLSNGNAFFYNGIAFMIIFGIVIGLCHWGSRRLNLLTKLPVIHQANAVAGGIISLGLVYVTVFAILVVFQVFPNDGWQNQLSSSVVAQWMIHNTPVISQQFITWLSNR